MIKNKNSFTLVELLVAVGISVLIITGVLITIIRSLILDEFNEKSSIGMNIARAQLEQIFSQRADFDTIVPVTNADIDTSKDPRLIQLLDGIIGAYRIEVSDRTDQLKDVRVLVCWKGRGGIQGDCLPDTMTYDPGGGVPSTNYPTLKFDSISGKCPSADGIHATCTAPIDITTSVAAR